MNLTDLTWKKLTEENFNLLLRVAVAAEALVVEEYREDWDLAPLTEALAALHKAMEGR